MTSAGNYDETKIKTLSSLEHIKLRPGMYIGRLGNGSHPDDGIYILLKEIIDNGVDEFIMGAGKQIIIKISDDGSGTGLTMAVRLRSKLISLLPEDSW